MWRTKQDVMNDLSIHDFDDDYIVRGEKPPPPCPVTDDNDEEIQLRFGRCGPPNAAGVAGPDLVGITHMLRMVNSFDTPEPKISPKKKQEPKQKILISKLNPDVKEFVPSSVIVNGNTTKIQNGSEPVEGKTVVIPDVEAPMPVSGIATTDNESKKRETVTALRNTIIRASKDDKNIEQKRKKNVAIMALLKLYSAPAATAVTEAAAPAPSPDPKHLEKSISPKPLVLITPDYFAEHRASPSKDIDNQEEKPLQPSPLLTPTDTPNPKQIIDPSIKESINKVEKWLKSPDKKTTKPAAPYTGTVTFRKKDTPSTSSPVSDVAGETKKQPKPTSPYIGPVTFKRKDTPSTSSPISDVVVEAKKAHHIPAYVPSPYAAELCKQLEEKAKAKEESDKKARLMKMDIFERLEEQLKEKDDIIRNRMRQQASTID